MIEEWGLTEFLLFCIIMHGGIVHVQGDEFWHMTKVNELWMNIVSELGVFFFFFFLFELWINIVDLYVMDTI